MRYREIVPNQKTEEVQPTQQTQLTKSNPQQRLVYPVTPDQARHAAVQRKLAYDIAQDANMVEPTELDRVKAFARYSQMQKQANANAAAQTQKAMTQPKQIDTRRQRR